jgi:hypothetical protein
MTKAINRIRRWVPRKSGTGLRTANEDVRPPKSVKQLAAEQGISGRPDYVRLATKVWRTPEELEATLTYLDQVRGRDKPQD